MKLFILKVALTLMVVASSVMGFAQSVGINATGAAPAPSAMLDVSSTTKGFLLPRMTTAQMNAIVAPAVPLLIFNTTVNCFEFWTGAHWQIFACNCLGPPSPPVSITGPLAVCSGAVGVVYSIAPVPGAVSYTWTVPAGATITSGQGTTSITVNFGATSGNVCVTATNSCGTSAPTCIAVTVNVTPPAPGPISGPAIVGINSVGNVFSVAPVPGATGYKWTIVPAGGTITAGQGTPTITVSFGPVVQTYTVCVYDSNACGKSAPTCMTVVSQVCPNVVVLDAVSGAAPAKSTGTINTITITTTAANEIIVIDAEGDTYGALINVSVAITGPVNGPGVFINQAQGTYGAVTMFAFAAPIAGTYTITVTEGNYSSTYSMNFAASFKGFCSPPSVAVNVASFGTNPDPNTCLNQLSITNSTTIANSMLFSGYGNSTCGLIGYNISWAGATNMGSADIPTDEDGSNGYTTCAAVAPYTVTVLDQPTVILNAGMCTVVIQP